MLGFGTQTDRRPLRRDTIVSHRQAARCRGRRQLHRQVRHQDPAPPPACPTPASGTLAEIERPALLGPLPGHDHHRLAARRRQATGDPRFRAWAHMLGYGGHFLTKSRRYSVTFGQLRAARTDYRRTQRHPTANATPGAAPR